MRETTLSEWKDTLASVHVCRTLPPLLRLPLIGLTWLLVCLLVIGAGLIVLGSTLVRVFLKFLRGYAPPPASSG